ncbi:MAG: hypothetical protein WDZ49_06080 [Litorilinea sp.]
MQFKTELFPRFNITSMSGVYAGVRADLYYRLRLWRMDQNTNASSEQSTPTLRWYQLNIPDTVPTVPDTPEPAWQLRRYAPADATTPADVEEDILLTLPPQALEPGHESDADMRSALPRALATAGLALHACGTCHFWRATGDSSAPIGSHSGRCTWHTVGNLPEAPAQLAADLAAQSGLALGCIHWQPGDPEAAPAPDSPQQAEPPPAAPPPAAKPGFWARLRGKRPASPAKPGPDLAVGERSGISAGTEPCFACPGRLANLGALVVESEQGDPLTYSVWRCRNCHATYLNRWADRWVRTETLETDESHYRIAPWEAAQTLTLIRGARAGDHPQGRTQRGELGAHLAAFAQSADLISRQIKQGR